MPAVRTGAQINPVLKKVVDGGIHDNEPLDVNNRLCSITGLPQDTMATPLTDPLYREDPATTLNCTPCPTITLTYDVESESTTTATAQVNPAGGTAPYTYAWSNGQNTQLATGLIKDQNYTVIVTDANECQVLGSITPNIQILTGLRLEMMYFGFNTFITTDLYYPRSCTGGHTCNRAKFEIFANTISQGIANLNNDGGPDDWLNSPPGTYDGYTERDRYFLKILTGTDAAAIAGPDGTVNITIDYVGTIQPPHNEASWVRISKEDGTILASTCMTTFSGYIFDPYS